MTLYIQHYSYPHTSVQYNQLTPLLLLTGLTGLKLHTLSIAPWHGVGVLGCTYDNDHFIVYYYKDIVLYIVYI